MICFNPLIPNNMKGFPVDIYSNGFVDGLSPIKEAKRATLIDKDLPEMFSVTPDAPALRLVRRNLSGESISMPNPMNQVLTPLVADLYTAQTVDSEN
jgi:hypothetical protein